MDNYTIKVDYEYDELDSDGDYIWYKIDISFLNQDGIYIYETGFTTDNLDNGCGKCCIPDDISGEWEFYFMIENANENSVRKYRNNADSQYYISFSANANNGPYNVITFKYTSAIDEMLLKLKEIYQLHLDKIAERNNK